MNNESPITVIGGGLAGSEAAWQAAERGIKVRLYEMRPVRPTPAHQSANLGEIVCSNSLKTDEPGTAPYLLKEELRRGGSLLIRLLTAWRSRRIGTRRRSRTLFGRSNS
jgi:methylenetetrahydrofolate--tRNA-(uracil-5-)-methyltransferase